MHNPQIGLVPGSFYIGFHSNIIENYIGFNFNWCDMVKAEDDKMLCTQVTQVTFPNIQLIFDYYIILKAVLLTCSLILNAVIC